MVIERRNAGGKARHIDNVHKAATVDRAGLQPVA
jgi:hypothetical protein